MEISYIEMNGVSSINTLTEVFPFLFEVALKNG